MVTMTTTATTTPRFVGIDLGGTAATALTDTGHSTTISTRGMPGAEAVISELGSVLGFNPARMQRIVIGAAGSVNPNGSVKLTNHSSWGVFHPDDNQTVVNDMPIKAAGLTTADVETVIAGSAEVSGRKVVTTFSTGVGVGLLLPDGTTVDSEGGHCTWQSTSQLEDKLLVQLRDILGVRLVSCEQVLGGRHMHNLYLAFRDTDYDFGTTDLRIVLDSMMFRGEDIGPIMTQLSHRGEDFAVTFMEVYGSIFGQALRNIAVTFRPMGGIYLTGGVMQPEVVQFLFTRTDARAVMLGGTTHNDWIAQIPVHLVQDRLLGAKGALAMAMRQG